METHIENAQPWEIEFNTLFYVFTKEGTDREVFPCEGGYCDMDVKEIKSFIRSQREQAKREGVEMAIKLLRQHPAEEGGYCDTGEDMDWYCRSQCTRLAIQRIKSKLLNN